MKKLIAIIAALVATQAHAFGCTYLADMYRAIAIDRDNGISIVKEQQAVIGNKQGDARVKSVILDAISTVCSSPLSAADITRKGYEYCAKEGK
jgi:hypothetical protein